MSNRFPLIFALLMILLPGVAAAQVHPSEISESLIKKSVKSVLGTDQAIEWQELSIADSVREGLEEQFKAKSKLSDTLHVGKVAIKGEKRYIIPDIAPSRSEKFSYLLFLNSAKEIVGVDVLEYRENYGYEIDYPFFRSQFEGKGKAQKIILGRTIQNISGATISARSLTNSIHDLMLIFNEIQLQ